MAFAWIAEKPNKWIHLSAFLIKADESQSHKMYYNTNHRNRNKNTRSEVKDNGLRDSGVSMSLNDTGDGWQGILLQLCMRTFIKTFQYYDFKMDTQKKTGKKLYICARVVVDEPPSFQSFWAKFVQNLPEKEKLHFYLLRSDMSILSKTVNQRLSDRHYTSKAEHSNLIKSFPHEK